MIIRTTFKQLIGGAMKRKDQRGLTTDGPSAHILLKASGKFSFKKALGFVPINHHSQNSNTAE